MYSDKPTTLLRLPVTVWVATLLYGTVLMLHLLTLKTSADYNPDFVLYTLLFVLAVNFITLITMLTCIKFYKNYRSAFIKRTELLALNIVVAFIYLIIIKNKI
jgi:hypothetical protein